MKSREGEEMEAICWGGMGWGGSPAFCLRRDGGGEEEKEGGWPSAVTLNILCAFLGTCLQGMASIIRPSAQPSL